MKLILTILILLVANTALACPICGVASCSGYGCGYDPTIYEPVRVFEGTPPTGYVWRFRPKVAAVVPYVPPVVTPQAVVQAQAAPYVQPSNTFVPYAPQGTTVYGQLSETANYGQGYGGGYGLPSYRQFDPPTSYQNDGGGLFMQQAGRAVNNAGVLFGSGMNLFTEKAAYLDAQRNAIAFGQGYLAAINAGVPTSVQRTGSFQATSGPQPQGGYQQGYSGQEQGGGQGSVVSARCIKCHNGPQAPQGFDFSNLAALDPERSKQAIRAVRAGRMPKNEQRLGPDETLQLVDEFLQSTGQQQQPAQPPGQQF